jgi:mannosyl-3-phosphoglycerate phosphatase
MYSLNPTLALEKILIFTDMDGTLLDHHNYSFKAALDTLESLKTRNALVIPNTSKTYSELIELRAEIGLDGPFIVENGAALYIPDDYALCNKQGFDHIDGFYVKSFARPRQHFIDLLNHLPQTFMGKFKAFHQMSLEEVAEYTDLPLYAAKQAQARQFGEPIKWLGNEADKQNFIEALKQLGGHVVEGGRFIHFADKTDKAFAMQFFKDLIQNQTTKNVVSVALGDGNNDISMLEQADISICIKSPVNPRLTIDKHDNVFYTDLEGPKGWAHSIQALIIHSKELS